ncbi:unnamed protein product [Acanthoscelides obtectus]|uniref:Uncharacterized protein n=1 Tax=Acanthoscelides obtectus TaxID=200917 RepID=A0A9P0LST3_ACAOB|nr:unnamed protein product [Acanthoscelides obtectus]CAK1629448.1 hypothetical protein AOBTE_LOCUS5751 [Acanthoscelides obtectus]
MFLKRMERRSLHQWGGNKSDSNAHRTLEELPTQKLLQNSRNARLFADVADKYEASMSVVPVNKTVPMPLTTRGLGFTVEAVHRKLASVLGDQIANTMDETQLYRYTLCQFALALKNGLPYLANTDVPVRDPGMYQTTREIEEVYAGNPSNFGVIAALINAVGKVSYETVVYAPFVPVAGLSPYHLTIQNLRSAVVAMSNRATPRELRVIFYEHNPIPGCIWNEELAEAQPPPALRQVRGRRDIRDRRQRELDARRRIVENPYFPLLMHSIYGNTTPSTAKSPLQYSFL